jgi:NAD(P)-dependent dehydrogenase (short-subunit alcohol dehydrogenase family)
MTNLSQIDMNGKVCVVTGGTSGIGWVSAYTLAQWGAHVVMIGRDRKRGLEAVERIHQESRGGKAEFAPVDLSAKVEVQKFVDGFLENHDRLDVLINNAGTTLLNRKLSVDGYEMTFAVNHLGHFLLTNLLLDTLKDSAPSRVINVSSDSHRGAKIDFDNLQGQSGYWVFKAYGQSKLANVLFTYELARHLDGTGVTVNAVHPGFVLTNMGRDNGWLIHKLVRMVMRLKGISTEEGAQTILYLAASPEVKGVTGKYFYKLKSVKSSSVSYDLVTARKLWQVSEELTGLAAS